MAARSLPPAGRRGRLQTAQPNIRAMASFFRGINSISSARIISLYGNPQFLRPAAKAVWWRQQWPRREYASPGGYQRAEPSTCHDEKDIDLHSLRRCVVFGQCACANHNRKGRRRPARYRKTRVDRPSQTIRVATGRRPGSRLSCLRRPCRAPKAP